MKHCQEKALYDRSIKVKRSKRPVKVSKDCIRLTNVNQGLIGKLCMHGASDKNT